ncbi:hypothetical protein ACFLZI_02550 [Nitrospirota bacterium]
MLVITVFMVLATAPSLCADTCPTEDFEHYSKELNNRELSSIQQLANRLKMVSNDVSEKCVSDLIVIYYRFYKEALDKFERIESIMFLHNKNGHVKTAQELSRKVAKVGGRIRTSEDGYYMSHEPAWIANELSDILPTSWKNYFALESIDLDERYADDGVLCISWEQLYQRIKRWETFNSKYPTFPFYDGINRTLSNYLEVFLTGYWNSEITDDYNVNKLRGEVKEAYELFLSDSKSSKYYRIVEGYYEILKRNDFMLTDESKKFLEDNNIRTRGRERMLG